jgi:hypothetical protein
MLLSKVFKCMLVTFDRQSLNGSAVYFITLLFSAATRCISSNVLLHMFAVPIYCNCLEISLRIMQL